MRRIHITAILTIMLALVMSMSIAANAESYTVNGECYFNEEGNAIVSDFSDEVFMESINSLEPGDEVTFKVAFSNEYKDLTHWYMRNDVIATLEDSYDRTENGGYTYKLTHVAPNGKKTVLFDNSEVGGETIVADLEGLHQGSNATQDWFFIQDMKNGETSYTELYVKYDGETEVNDYMDTYSALRVSYAVELDNSKTKKTVKTGDETNLLTPIATFVAALLMLILTIISFRKDRRNVADGDAAVVGGKERE